MEICYVRSLFWSITGILFFFFYFTPFLVSTLPLSNRAHPHFTNASDQEALIGFLSAITYDPTQSLSATWKQNVSFCDWTRVICSRRRQRVVSLNVSGMGLQGIISPLLGNLSFLRILDLSDNKFHGLIPYQLGNLFRLKTLYLRRNQLQDSIPPTLGGCRSLRFLSMYTNNLKGNIPEDLCILPNLQLIDLGRNNLTGTIPACLGNISRLALEYILFHENHLHGSVPSELGMLTHVTIIYLYSNHLSGQIPSSLSNCTSLQELAIGANQLTGNIPTELCSKKNSLTGLYLLNNQLSGGIPASLVNCTNLQVISLGGNHLNGVVPEEFGKMTQLRRLWLGVNQLVSGSTTSLPILTALTNCSNICSIDLGDNNLMGRLPFSIGRLSTKLYVIRLSFNRLAGEIPSQIGNLTSLSALALPGNSFTGAVPSSIKMLHNLERLYIGGNSLEGKIPTEIGQLKSLGLLDVGVNNLSGRIPDSIGHLQDLRYLNLDHNQLSGNIPASLGKCMNLLYLDLSYNMLSGPIPPQIANLANLALFFNLSNNLLHGPIPLEVSKMTMVQAIDISANRLTGYMAYLHHHCFMQVIHCDLKPNNVLLGEDMTAYLIDFGIATICFADSKDLALTSTHALKGSTGYIPPEYGLGGCVTTKGDVYSYGVVLLEILTRKKPTHNMFVEGMNLQKWVGSAFPNQVREVVDKSLLRRTSTITEEDKELNCLNHLVNVGLLCTKESPEGRPTMINIVGMLQNIRDAFIRVAGIPNFKANITHLIGSTSTTCNIIGEGESSSTF